MHVQVDRLMTWGWGWGVGGGGKEIAFCSNVTSSGDFMFPTEQKLEAWF